VGETLGLAPSASWQPDCRWHANVWHFLPFLGLHRRRVSLWKWRRSRGAGQSAHRRESRSNSDCKSDNKKNCKHAERHERACEIVSKLRSGPGLEQKLLQSRESPAPGNRDSMRSCSQEIVSVIRRRAAPSYQCSSSVSQAKKFSQAATLKMLRTRSGGRFTANPSHHLLTRIRSVLVEVGDFPRGDAQPPLDRHGLPAIPVAKSVVAG
jgi:hypothetical protein